MSEEDATLAALRRQYAEAEKAIDNILNAMQQGIITPSTKERLQKLEAEKEELSVQITKQEIEKPRFSKEQILYFIRQFRELDLSKTAHRRKLVDCFVNAIYLYDDKLVITYNYSRSSETIPLSEITEKESGSDFTATGSPRANSPNLFPLRNGFGLFFISTMTRNTAGRQHRHEEELSLYPEHSQQDA